MSDEKLDKLSGLFLQLDLQHKYGWTFNQFVKSYESKYVQQIIEKERSK